MVGFICFYIKANLFHNFLRWTWYFKKHFIVIALSYYSNVINSLPLFTQLYILCYDMLIMSHFLVWQYNVKRLACLLQDYLFVKLNLNNMFLLQYPIFQKLYYGLYVTIIINSRIHVISEIFRNVLHWSFKLRFFLILFMFLMITITMI